MTRLHLRHRSRPSSSFSAASSRGSPAVAGTLPLPGPVLTVSVTSGFEQKKVRKAQSSAASSAGGEAAGSCSSTVFGRRFALDPLHLADREAVLLQQGDRDVELVAGHVRAPRCWCRGSGRGRSGRRSGPRRPRRRSSQSPALARLLLGRPRPPPRPAPRRPAAAPRRSAVPPPAPGSFSAASRAAMKASALWKRSPGSFSSARITTASSAGETWGLIELGRCGVCETCFIATATALVAPRRGPARSAPRRGSRRSSRGRRRR